MNQFPGKPKLVEQKETLTPNTINVFAVQEIRKTKMGRGFSTPLEEPETSKYYMWNGKLHNMASDVTGASNQRQDVEGLAENLAEQCKAHSSKAHREAGVPSYSMVFTPTDEQKAEVHIENNDISRFAMGLTEIEQHNFVRAYQKTNETPSAQ